MKKLISLRCGDDLLTQAVVKCMKSVGACQGEISLRQATVENLPASLRIEQTALLENQPYKNPLQVQEHQVRQFFSKLQLGVVAVQNYSGVLLKTPKEVCDYFESIAGRAFGEDWSLKKIHHIYVDKPDGVYVISGLTKDQVEKLNGLVSPKITKVAILSELETADESQWDVVERVSETEEKSIENVTTNLLNKIRTIWKGKTNERTTT